jgi:hypothetical protein
MQKSKWMTAALAIAAAVTGGLAVATPAHAATAAGPCVMEIDSITAAGNLTAGRITATTPPTAEEPGAGTHLFTAGIAKASTTWFSMLGTGPGITYSGSVILNDTLYNASFGYDDGTGDPFQKLTKVGSGWGTFTAVEESIYQPYVGSSDIRSTLYGLRNDGTLFRWTPETGNTWRAAGSAAGFSSYRALTLISQTGTYDTFLAITKSGGLATIRLPLASPLKPVIKVIRTSGFGAYDSLVAEKCGTQSTLLTAIDKQTGKADLYAVGHANGAATAISPLGQVPGNHPDAINFRGAPDTAEHLYGE